MWAARAPRGTLADMKRVLGIVGIALLAAGLAPEAATGDGAPGPSPGPNPGPAPNPTPTSACPTPAQPLRYPDVQPIFVQRCAKCHDARLVKNDAAQAVFEMTSYPFSTKRPDRLLGDLRGTLPSRGLSADEKCRAMSWLSAGALDAAGNPPRWR